MAYNLQRPAAPAPMGKGGASSQRGDTLHERSLHESEQNRLGLLAIQHKGIHKLMRSGTRKGKFVKFFYRLIWDFTYR